MSSAAYPVTMSTHSLCWNLLVSSPEQNKKRYVYAIVWLVLAIFTVIALYTAHPEDSSWIQAGAGVQHNAAGVVGSHLAAVLTLLLGSLKWLVPLLMLWRVRLYWRNRGWVKGPIQALAMVTAVCALAALVSLHVDHPGAVLPNESAGLLGATFSSAMWHFLGTAGSTLILLAVFILGFTLASGLNWNVVFERVGEVLSMLWQRIDAFIKQRTELSKTNQDFNRPSQQAANKPRQAPVLLTPKAPETQATYVPPAKPRHEISIAQMAEVKPAKKPESQGQLFGTTMGEGLLPAVSLLDQPTPRGNKGFSPETLEAMSRLLEIKLKEFNVDAEVVAVQPGPVITRFEIQPAPGVKVARISNIAKDLARAMAMISVRVVEVIPGKSVVGIEVPNQDREMVRLSEILTSQAFQGKGSPLSLALGKDIAGHPVVADLAKMPHLLVAGTTGSGKSVGVNAMILSMLFKAGPSDLRLIMIDPKMLELSVYDKIPHLLTPVVTDMKDAANALRWCVAEMERRYKMMSKLGVRNLDGCNKKIMDAIAAGTPLTDPLWKPGENVLDETAPELNKLPYIVVIIDEFADMMMIVGKKVEELIARIAQKARAAGIHLILATQRPSVDVITGLIKANIPTRMAFQVSSKIDSRTILDQGGAEMLLGNGDMLFLPPGTSLSERVHGAFVSDEEVHRVCDDWRARGEPIYIDEILEGSLDANEGGKGSFGGFDDVGGDPEQDALYDEAVAFVLETRRPSISFVQRKFKIGYNRAARLIEAMENAGVVSSMSSNGQREIIVPRHD